MVHVLKTPTFCLLVSLLFMLPECNGFQTTVVATVHKLNQNARASQTAAPFASHEQQLAVNNSPCTSDRSSMDTSIRLFYKDDDNMDAASYQRQREFEMKVNSFLRASQDSFQNVEAMTNSLLNRQPLLALAIFVGAGALVAYLSGLVFLGGYIETWNPVENDSIPYWDEEILVITRKVGR